MFWATVAAGNTKRHAALMAQRIQSMNELIFHFIFASLLTVIFLTGEVRERHLLYAVFAALLNALAVGAPAVPGFLIFSPDPLAIRLRLAWMFAYNPFFGFLITISPCLPSKPQTFYPWLCFFYDAP
jgi:hypothetical protein